jgi:hypothetical protein
VRIRESGRDRREGERDIERERDRTIYSKER